MSLDTSARPSPPPPPRPASAPQAASSATTTAATAAHTSTTSHIPTPVSNPSQSQVPLSQVSLIHRVADSKRSARLLQQHQQHRAMRHTPPPHSSSSSALGSVPQSSSSSTTATTTTATGNQQQQQNQVSKGGGRSRVKGLDSNRQAELSKMLKCQQNAEHRQTQGQGQRSTPGLQLSTDSGFQSRPASDAVLTDYGVEGHRAAVLIQAVWRGYWAREHSLEVVSIRKEIRARRAEDHIVLLRAELDRHKKLYNEEKRLRTLQMEAIRCLYHEVQQLKSHMHSSRSSTPNPSSRPGTADSTGSGSTRLGQSNSSTGLGTGISAGTGTGPSDFQRTAELENTCQSLQNQVWELKQALQSMTSHVFRQDSISLNSLSSAVNPGGDQLWSVEVMEGEVSPTSHPDHQTHQPSSVCYWSSIPHSLSPYPSEEEEQYLRQVPQHGAPTPPRHLTVQHKTDTSVQLNWLPSRLSIDHNSADPKSIVTGYCVYINDQLKGKVKSTAASVLGLSPSATYKFYIRALSSVGESYESNIVMARLARGGSSDRQLHNSDSSESDVLPDSDKDCDSSDMANADKRRTSRNKRDSRKHRKARSPRSDKKKATATAVEEGNVGKEKRGGGEGGGEGERERGRKGSSVSGAAATATSSHHHHHYHRDREEGGGEESGGGGILTHPKLHKHRRTHSKEQSELSSLESTPSSTPNSRPGGREGGGREGDESARPPSSTPTSTHTTPPSARSTPPSSSLPRSTPTPPTTGKESDAVQRRRAGSPARDLSFKSPSPQLERKGRGSPLSAGAGHYGGDVEPRSMGVEASGGLGRETPVVLSETFTVDNAKSFLRNLGTPPPYGHPPASVDEGGAGDGGSGIKGHQRKHSKDLAQDSTTPSPSFQHRDRDSPSHHRDRSSPQDRPATADDASSVSVSSRVKTHRRNRSREMNILTSMEDGGGGGRGDEEAGGERGGAGKEKEKDRCNTPVLDGRRRASSRPSSPMIFDGPAVPAETSDTTTTTTTTSSNSTANPLAELSRRKTNAEMLVQRLRKSPSPSSKEQGDGEREKVSPQYGNRSRKQSPSSPDSLQEESASSRPHSSAGTRPRTLSTGSDSDLVCMGGDRKLFNAQILANLDMLETKMSESRRRKRSSEDEQQQQQHQQQQHRRGGCGRTRHVSESDNDISSDPGSHLPPRAPPASDSSSGSHSDDNKARHHHSHHRGHRRSPSDQRPVTAGGGSGYSSDQVGGGGRHTHSPIIMEGASKKGGSSVRRNASFHALLPSRPHDSQPSPAPEDLASGGGGALKEEVTSPQESQGNPRSSIRSRSPSPGPNRQPILSGAQLKRHTSDPSARPSS